MQSFRQNVLLATGVVPAVLWAWAWMQSSMPDVVIGVSTAAVCLGCLKIGKAALDRLWRAE